MPNLIEYDPFKQIDRLFAELDRRLQKLREGLNSVPRPTVQEENNEVCIRLPLPRGTAKPDLSITAKDGHLHVKGQFGIKHRTRRGLFQSEQVFYHVVPLPQDVNTSELKGDLRGGVLTIRMPKKRSGESKQ